MSFTSFAFLIFVAITVILYYLVPKKYRWVVLLAASYFYYLEASAKSFVFILCTTIITFFAARLIEKAEMTHKDYLAANKGQLTLEQKKASKETAGKTKKKWLIISLVIDFGILICLKYFRYYLGALGIGIFASSGVLIPLGISFYTFQSAGYLFDVYRGKTKADDNIAKFALFTSFFPQIIQGPIPRYDQLAGQLYEGHDFRYKNLAHGAQLMLWGFFKKLVIADRIGTLVGEVYINWQDYSGWPVIVAMFGYAIQLYMDFSGGVDIARGVARCMGIDMARNFRRPYFAIDLTDFWRRWHISLSFWTRDYIFFAVAMSKPIGKFGRKCRKVLGDRVGKLIPVFIGQICVFLIIGMWHGAELRYIAYGMYNAAIIISGMLLEPYFVKWLEKLHINREGKGWTVFRMIRTFCIVSFGRIFSNGQSFKACIHMMKSIFRPYRGGFMTAFSAFALTKWDYVVLFFACVIVFCVSVVQERRYNYKKAHDGG
ncbi:MAG: MBOAT family protein, partial [Bacillota bacterium]|nr:MBOAT family protein [Bacillota bacterium]